MPLLLAPPAKVVPVTDLRRRQSVTDVIQTLAGIGISVLAGYMLFQAVPMEQLGRILMATRAWAVALGALAVVGSLLGRAERWRACFAPSTGGIAFPNALGTLSISYLVSSVVPLRAGEVVRAVLLGRRESLPVLTVIGTIVLEKWFDFLVLAALFAGLLVAGGVADAALVAGVSAVLVVVVGFGLLIALAARRARTLRMLQAAEARLPAYLSGRLGLASRVEQLSAVSDTLRYGPSWIRLLIWSAVTWVFSLATVWAGAQAVDVALGLSAVTVVALVTSVGQAIPSSPGYVGVYHAATVVALSSFGVDPPQALGVAVLVHALSYGTLMLAGLTSLWAGGYGLADLRSARSEGRRAAAIVR
jgi:uncharacterized protein (TIRG00374 family)